MKLFFFFIGITTVLFNIDLTSVRDSYKEAVVSKEKTVALYEEVVTIKKTDNKKLVAYKGAITALKAKYEKGVKTKKELFKKGVTLVEYAVKSKPNDIEIRFIRLTIQQNIPAFLKYNSNKEEDKKFIITNFKFIKSFHLKKHIQGYVLQSEHFSKEEKALFK